MGHILLKTAPDADLYVLWSSICDAPIGVGNQEEIQRVARLSGDHISPERFARADATGTSSVFGDGGWDDEGLVLREFPTVDSGSRWLPRKNLHKFAEAIKADNSCAIEELVEPIDPQVHPVIEVVIEASEDGDH